MSKWVNTRVSEDTWKQFSASLNTLSEEIGRPVSRNEIIVPAINNFIAAVDDGQGAKHLSDLIHNE